jgi:spore maturation protein A
MMKYIFGGMVIVSIIFGIINGSIADVSNSVISEGVSAVELGMYMMGGMCVWGGIMRVAEKSGLTEKLCFLFKPMARFIFKGIDPKGKAFKAMIMNVTANLLGLGNAATPFGMEAMRELEKEEKTGDTASDNMILFTVLNTASITLIPTTAATLRLKHGSTEPFVIIPCVLLCSVTILVVTMSVTMIVNKLRKKKLTINNE